MQTANAKTISRKRLLLLDAALIAAACLVPAFSHLTALPLYQLNPMLLLLLVGMTVVDDRRNAYLLALLLPVVSMLAVGMPAPAKALCMAVEYGTVVLVYGLLSKRGHLDRMTAILLAMLAGKVCFYILKSVVIAPAVLIGTSVWLQLVNVLLLAALFGVMNVFKK